MPDAAQDSGPPQVIANVAPVDMAGAAHARIIVEAVKESVAELKADVREIKTHRFTDLLWHITAFAAGFVILASMMIAAYFKIEDKIHTLSTSNTRIETKLEDLLQRIPPIPTLPPGRK